MQQRQISADPCGPKLQPGPCVVIGPGPVLPPQLTIGPPEVLKKPASLSPILPMKVPDQMQLKSGSTPAPLTSISRPRPTALGTKAAPKMPRITTEPSREIDLIPVCIPGPQSANTLTPSPTEPTLPVLSPQSPHSPQSYLSPNSTLSPKPSPPPQPQKITSAGSSTQSQAQPEKQGGENNDFR